MYKSRIMVLLIIVLLLGSLPVQVAYGEEAAASNDPGAVLYVANNGSDSNPGTLEAPFLTLEKARDTVRQLKQAGGLPDGGITVYLRGGIYNRTESFLLEEQDSGTADKPVTYRAYPGESVRLDGGRQLAKD